MKRNLIALAILALLPLCAIAQTTKPILAAASVVGPGTYFLVPLHMKLIPIDEWEKLIRELKKRGWQVCVWGDGPVPEAHLDFLLKHMN